MPDYLFPLWMTLLAHIGLGKVYSESRILAEHKQPERIFAYQKTGWEPFISTGLPHFAQAGFERRISGKYGFHGLYGFFPETKVASAKVRMDTYEIGGEWFPYQDSFFFGLALGDQIISANKKQDVLSFPIEAKISLATYYLTPKLGWRWVKPSGWVFGFDLGWQFALNATTSVDTEGIPELVKTSAQYKGVVKEVQDSGEKYGTIGLPAITLLHVGYLF